MGCCYSTDATTTTGSGSAVGSAAGSKQVALKFPHGLSGVLYCQKQKQFIKCNDINSWLTNLYLGKTWTNWQVYNDETSHLGDNHHKKGHCKGIVAWNTSHISWLCHSVPNFPRQFSGDSISEIESGELIYGQSFQYIEFEFTSELLARVLNQLQIMEAHIFIENTNNFNQLFLLKNTTICELKLTDNITHFAKSPAHHIDIYNDVLAKQYPSITWYVESWIRGHHIVDVEGDVERDGEGEGEGEGSLIKDIKQLHFEEIEYKESQDHSKWATTENSEYYWVGDLNRMTSQYSRGGGGFVCKDADIARAFYKLIV